MLPRCGCFHFTRLFCYEALAVKLGEIAKKLFCSTSSAMTNVLIDCLVDMNLAECSSRIEKKNMTRLLVFKLKAFDSEVSFFDITRQQLLSFYAQFSSISDIV